MKKCIIKLKTFLYSRFLSEVTVNKNTIIKSPTLFLGKGKVNIGQNVQFGYYPSPFFYSHYSHIEARKVQSTINIGDNTIINNNASIISDGASITIGKNCLIGPSVEIYDTDFHEIDPALRVLKSPIPKKVIIHDNVFIGSGVKILKGVTIGNNCVIGAGSVVVKSFPDNCIIAGNPAKKIKEI